MICNCWAYLKLNLIFIEPFTFNSPCCAASMRLAYRHHQIFMFLMRILCLQVLHVLADPYVLRFCKNKHGKPMLDPTHAADAGALCFNLTHTSSLIGQLLLDHHPKAQQAEFAFLLI